MCFSFSFDFSTVIPTPWFNINALERIFQLLCRASWWPLTLLFFMWMFGHFPRCWCVANSQGKKWLTTVISAMGTFDNVNWSNHFAKKNENQCAVPWLGSDIWSSCLWRWHCHDISQTFWCNDQQKCGMKDGTAAIHFASQMSNSGKTVSRNNQQLCRFVAPMQQTKGCRCSGGLCSAVAVDVQGLTIAGDEFSDIASCAKCTKMCRWFGTALAEKVGAASGHLGFKHLPLCLFGTSVHWVTQNHEVDTLSWNMLHWVKQLHNEWMHTVNGSKIWKVTASGATIFSCEHGGGSELFGCFAQICSDEMQWHFLFLFLQRIFEFCPHTSMCPSNPFFEGPTKVHHC